MLRHERGATGIYYNREPEGVPPGDGIRILAPTAALAAEANAKGNSNNLSYVLKLEYAGIKVILPGDAEAEVWDDIVASHPAADLKCHVLKASHHGRDSGYHEAAVAAMKPEYTIVSVGKKPDTDASNKYRKHSEHVWSTRWRGNIVLTIQPGGRAQITSEYIR